MWLVVLVPICVLVVSLGLQRFEAVLIADRQHPTRRSLRRPAAVGSSHAAHISFTGERATLGAYADPTV